MGVKVEVVNVHQRWLKETVSMARELGYRVTPVYKSGATAPFANEQTYSDIDDPKWNNAIHVGVCLDDALLVDYDGNHAQRDGAEIISTADLAEYLELSEMPSPVQNSKSGDSIHWLFRFPSYLDRSKYRQSATPLQYVDIKTGNQLMHLKCHKILTDGVLPDKTDLPYVPGPLLESLYKGEKQSGSQIERAKWSGALWEVEAAAEILKYIPQAETYGDWLDVLMRVHDKFGFTDTAVQLCDEWSCKARNYDGIESVRSKLASFRNGGIDETRLQNGYILSGEQI
ncbi:MAG: hypothetical protein ACI8UP_000138 [Porticoccaceae bacterium]|jgi:hypothetical protein